MLFSPECAAVQARRRARVSDFWSGSVGFADDHFRHERAARDPAGGLCRRLCAADAERRDAFNPPPIRSRWHDAHPDDIDHRHSLRTPAQTAIAYAQTNAATACTLTLSNK